MLRYFIQILLSDDEMSVDDGECNDEKKTEESEEKIEKGTVESINEEVKLFKNFNW